MCAGVRSIDEMASSTILLINHAVLLIRIRKIFERKQVSFHFSGLKKINTRGFRVKQKQNGHKRQQKSGEAFFPPYYGNLKSCIVLHL